MTSLVSDIFGLRPDEPIAADMALETPQVMVRWRLANNLPDIDTVSVRRSLFRFPESLSEGTVLLDEAPTDQASIRTSYSDIAVDPFKVYYYSVFFTHKGPYSMDLNIAQDIERLGILRGAFNGPGLPYDKYWILARDEGGDPVLWLYNTVKRLVDGKVDLSQIITERDERVVSIVDFVDGGATYDFSVVTARRYIEFTISSTAETVESSDITGEFDFLSTITPGFEIQGATTVGADIAVLDSANLEVVTLTTLGVVSSTMDISGLDVEGNLRGLSEDPLNSRILLGAGKVIYAIDQTATTPDNTDILALYPVRQGINADFYLDSPGSALILPDDNLDEIQRYSFLDLSSQVQIEEGTVPGPGVVGLWRLEDSSAPVVDSSGNGNDATLIGVPTLEVSGKFGSGVSFPTVTDGLDLSAAVGVVDVDDGFVSFWWKSPYTGYRAGATAKTLFQILTDASNELIIEGDASSNDVTCTFTRGGTGNTATITAAQLTMDDDVFHNITVLWSGGAGGTLAIYLDGVLGQSVTMNGVYAGAVASMNLGDASGATFLGTYDDLALGDAAPTLFARYALVTRGNRAHALSGRDYDDAHQHWRDDLKLEFQEYPLRNDFRITTLAQDEALADDEVILRQTADEVTLGSLGGLSRLFGLLLDRNTDRRKFFMNHVTARSVEYEFVDELGELIRAAEIDPSWNVDMRRRFLEVMFFCYQRSGTLDAFKRMVRFLGFRMLCPDDVVGELIQYYRRFFDSVVDPDRPDVPFDTSHFDSGADDVQLADIQAKFYKQNFSSSTGSTLAAVSRRLVDPSAVFFTDAEIGSLILINDQDTPGDNGQYLITSLISNTEVEVDRDWPVGSLASLQYRLHWRVPVPDPYNDQIIARLDEIKVRWQNFVVT